MRVRFLVFAAPILLISFGALGCGGGINEGAPPNLAEDPENIKQQKIVEEENIRLMKNPLDVKKK